MRGNATGNDRLQASPDMTSFSVAKRLWGANSRVVWWDTAFVLDKMQCGELTAEEMGWNGVWLDVS